MTSQQNDLVAEVLAYEAEVCRILNSEFLTDASAMLKVYNDAPDIHLFDMMAPLQNGGNGLQTRGQEFIDHFWEVAPFYTGEVRMFDVNVHAEGNMAFVAMIQTYTATDKDGNVHKLAYRVTDCLQKLNGGWRIVHEHLSLPVSDMVKGTSQFWASVDGLEELKPAKSKTPA